jgi:copper ion binding protein
MEKQTLTVSKISCGHCVATIQKELQELDGVAKVNGDLQTKTITVEWQKPASKSQIEDRLAEIGYPASA